MTLPTESILARGVRVHNLKNIDVEIPHDAFVVITGVSGSGKSSLAFDTIYAEGQRRYVESLSAYARQFLERIEKPDADEISGIAPAVAIRQKNTTRNPRSTVATATEIYDYLRLLFARVGRTFCARCGAEVKKDTVDEVADRILAAGEGIRFNVLFPLQPIASARNAQARPHGPGKRTRSIGVAQSDTNKERLFTLRERGFNRLFQNGKIFEFSTPESLLDINFLEPVYVLVDRIVTSPEVRSRLVDAIETGFREAGEVVFEQSQAAGQQFPDLETGAGSQAGGNAQQGIRFSQCFECKQCLTRYPEPEPRMFSFNNPFGACPRCQGFGNTTDFDMNLVIPDKNKTLAAGAIEPWTKPKYKPLFQELRRSAKELGIPLDVPWRELPPEQRELIIDGKGKFRGVRGFFQHLERKKYKLHVRVFLSRYRGYTTCSDCGGMRLRPEARQVQIADRNISAVCALTVENAAKFFESLVLKPEQAQIAGDILAEIRSRLRFLAEVGLQYLTLDRLASTLSGGEAQRIQLASALGSRLVGTLYVLDEPSIGLHPRDTHQLINILKDLRELGNTILVVEHDRDVMRASDRIIDLGPGAGENGGNVIAAGTYEEILRDPHSLTGRFLSGELKIPVPPRRRTPGVRQLRITGARAHNLKGIDVSIPLHMMVAITGVSGSGKSTLVHDVLFRTLKQALGPSLLTRSDATGERPDANDPTPSAEAGVSGTEFIDDVVLVDQSPIGRTPRSNPVTYIKAFDAIRELFASLPESRKRGYATGHFSFNVPGGRCEACQGDGTVTVEMQFLADVELVCEECKGARYKPAILEVSYRGKNIHQVLNLTVKEALHLFASAPKIV
ncbi:MAG: excinuclease ABC subunit A, partial [Terriglobales bacterium]